MLSARFWIGIVAIWGVSNVQCETAKEWEDRVIYQVLTDRFSAGKEQKEEFYFAAFCRCHQLLRGGQTLLLMNHRTSDLIVK